MSRSTGCIKSLSHSSNSSGYITETEQVPLASCVPSEMQLQKQSRCTSEVTVNIEADTRTSISHVGKAINSTHSAKRDCDITQVHEKQFTRPANVLEGCVTTDMHRKKSATSTCSVCTSDIVLLYNSTGGVNHELQAINQDMLFECNLSLNPSHFQPLDSLCN